MGGFGVMSIGKRLRLRSGRDRRGGVALLFVVSILLPFSVLTLGAAQEGRIATAAAIGASSEAAAVSAAEATLVWASLALAAEAQGLRLAADRGGVVTDAVVSGRPPFDASRPLRHDGTPARWRFGDAEATVRIQAEAGRYDLTRGDPRLLAPILAAAGAKDPERAARAILDARRGAGRVRALNWRIVAGDFADREAALARAPELAPVWDELAAWLTVHGGLTRPDPASAPDGLLDALPLSEEARRAIRAERAAPPPRRAPTRDPAVFEILVEARIDDGATARRRARYLVDGNGPPRLLDASSY